MSSNNAYTTLNMTFVFQQKQINQSRNYSISYKYI